MDKNRGPRPLSIPIPQGSARTPFTLTWLNDNCSPTTPTGMPPTPTSATSMSYPFFTQPSLGNNSPPNSFSRRRSSGTFSVTPPATLMAQDPFTIMTSIHPTNNTSASISRHQRSKTLPTLSVMAPHPTTHVYPSSKDSRTKPIKEEIPCRPASPMRNAILTGRFLD
ncbi:uncharacterized protein VTP21DRAFT_11013 [Calcarisporiella thermophila]|uniref:uncharacterized protein n=1 Tax=Calcarisporiella thermophila TaxID=911321 RepID=UPI003743C44C